MTYIADVPQQVTAFLYAVGFGFLIGLLYDVFRAVRHAVSDGKKAFFISDVLFAFSETIRNSTILPHDPLQIGHPTTILLTSLLPLPIALPTSHLAPKLLLPSYP